MRGMVLKRSVEWVLVLLLLVQFSSAFFFRRSKPKTRAASAVDAECVEKARRGDCEFFKCFDERHPCGEGDTYAIKHGWRFCSRFDLYQDRMTAEGRRWLNGSRLCTMERLLEYYRDGQISCSEVNDKMKDVQAECEAENGLCQGRILIDNKDIFSDVYAFNRRSAVHFLHTIKQCTLAKFREAASWFRDQLHNLGGGEDVSHLPGLSYFQDIDRRMAELKDSFHDHFGQLRDTVRHLGSNFKAENNMDDDDDDVVEID